MTTPIAQVQVSLNGGAWQSGGLPAPFSATVDFQAQTSQGVQSYTWELPDYPPGLALPPGWTNVNGVYTFNGPTPPRVTLPASGVNNWGKIPVRLRVNGNPLQYDPATGALSPSYQSKLTDTATVLSILSPSLGIPGLAFAESTQFDSLRSFIGEHMKALRALEARVGSAQTPSAVVKVANYTLLPGDTTAAFNTTAGGAAGLVCTLPAVPTQGYPQFIKNRGPNPLTLQPQGGALIDGNNSAVLASGAAATIVWMGDQFSVF